MNTTVQQIGPGFVFRKIEAGTTRFCRLTSYRGVGCWNCEVTQSDGSGKYGSVISARDIQDAMSKAPAPCKS